MKIKIDESSLYLVFNKKIETPWLMVARHHNNFLDNTNFTRKYMALIAIYMNSSITDKYFFYYFTSYKVRCE